MRNRVHLPSPAAFVGLIAMLVALSGASYAAVQANSVGAKQIKANAVRADEIQDGSVGSAELGDGSDAAAEAGNGALGSAEFGDGALDGADFGDGAVGPPDLLDETLGSADFSSGGLGSAEFGNGSLTGADVQDQSLDGSDFAGLDSGDFAPRTFLGDSVTTQFFQAPSDLADGATQTFITFCPAGQVAIGGGWRGDDTDDGSTATNSGAWIPSVNPGSPGPPTADGGTFTGWGVEVTNLAGGATTGIRPEVWAICAEAS